MNASEADLKTFQQAEQCVNSKLVNRRFSAVVIGMKVLEQSNCEENNYSSMTGMHVLFSVVFVVCASLILKPVHLICKDSPSKVMFHASWNGSFSRLYAVGSCVYSNISGSLLVCCMQFAVCMTYQFLHSTHVASLNLE